MNEEDQAINKVIQELLDSIVKLHAKAEKMAEEIEALKWAIKCSNNKC